MPIAIIDLGTNTFNLLIAKPAVNGFTILYSTRIGVKLGRGGIGNNTILPDAFERGINALQQYANIMQQYGVIKHRAYATSAIRTALNGTLFIEQAKQKFNINIELITGHREAELIYKGIKLTNNFAHNYIILDIGGGSNEFIICNNSQILWKESFPLGMARLIEKFNPSDPILESQIESMRLYFEQQLQPLFEACKQYKVSTLVGAEGSFETIYNILFDHKADAWQCYPIELPTFYKLHQQLIDSDPPKRLAIKGLEPIRVEMIVPAVIFINFIIERIGITELYASFFSLKEGAMSEMLTD